MMLAGVLLRFWPYLAGAALVIGASWFLHHRGFESGYAASEAKWQPLFAAAEKARDAANEKARHKEEDSIQLSRMAEAEHEKSVASLTLRAADADKRIRALGVRLAAASACRVEVSSAPGSSAEPDAASAGIARADRAGASISDTGRRCELDASALAAWQQFYIQLRSINNRED